MNSSAADVNEYLAGVPEWQRVNLDMFRELVHKVQPAVGEDIKWGVPVFVQDGKVVLAMSSFKAHTKFNFIANCALLDDPKKLFNNGLESKKSRSIDLQQGDTIELAALQDLVAQVFVQISN